MRIPVLFLYAAPHLGSVWTVCRNVINHLDPARFDVHVAVDRNVDGTIGVGSHVRVTPWDLRWARGDGARAALGCAGSVALLARYARASGVRIIHSNDDANSAVLAAAVARAAGAKLLLHYHVTPRIFGQARRKLMQGLARAADMNVGVSRFMADEIRGIRAGQQDITWIANGIEADVFRPDLDGSGLRSELGIAADEILVAQVSRIWRDKRQEDLVRAFAIARRRVPTLRCLIIGWEDPRYAGPFGSYRLELADICARQELGDSIIVSRARADAPLIHAATDISVLPSVNEPFGLVVAEAMACGKPVIGARSGAIPEIIEHEKTGLLVEPLDPEALAAAIVRLAMDPLLRARLGAAGRRRVVDHFSASRTSSEFAELYARLAGDADRAGQRA